MAVAKPPYPLEVRRSLDRGHKECRAENGAVPYEPVIVRTADLTGDGRPDFVVDYRAARCSGYLGMFNRTRGWDLEILVTNSRGRVVPVFAGRVRDHDLSSGPGPSHERRFDYRDR